MNGIYLSNIIDYSVTITADVGGVRDRTPRCWLPAGVWMLESRWQWKHMVPWLKVLCDDAGD